jgi:hypothetical protein
MSIRIINPKTGKVMIEEDDNGQLTIVDESIRHKINDSIQTDDGRLPSPQELKKMVERIEKEETDAEVE